MAKGKILTNETRREISNFHKEGKSTEEIIQSFHVSKSTISQLRKKLRNNEKITSKKVLGRKRKVSKREENKIIIYAKRNKFTSISEISRIFSIEFKKSISRHTISRILKSQGIRSIIAKRKPNTSKSIRKKRLDFCNRHRLLNSAGWNKVVFID